MAAELNLWYRQAISNQTVALAVHWTRPHLIRELLLSRQNRQIGSQYFDYSNFFPIDLDADF